MISIEENFQKLSKMSDTKCFGCSPTNDVGLNMSFHSNGEKVVSLLTISQHLCGWKNIVHGGIVSTILDETMSWAAIYLLERIILTKSITVNFKKPVFSGQPIKSEGTVKEHVSEREAIMAGTLYNSDGDVCATSSGVFALFTVEAAEKTGIIDDVILNDFKNFIT